MIAPQPLNTIKEVPKIVAKEVEIFDIEELRELQDVDTGVI